MYDLYYITAKVEPMEMDNSDNLGSNEITKSQLKLQSQITQIKLLKV